MLDTKKYFLKLRKQVGERFLLAWKKKSGGRFALMIAFLISFLLKGVYGIIIAGWSRQFLFLLIKSLFPVSFVHLSHAVSWSTTNKQTLSIVYSYRKESLSGIISFFSNQSCLNWINLLISHNSSGHAFSSLLSIFPSC